MDLWNSILIHIKYSQLYSAHEEIEAQNFKKLDYQLLMVGLVLSA